MIFLNLLPRQYKVVIKAERINLSLKQDFLVLLAVLILASVPLIFVRSFLSQKFRILSENQKAIQAKSQNFNKEVNAINTRIENLYTIQKKFRIMSQPILDITNKVPESVALISLSLDPKEDKVVIKGVAKNRDDLLKFKQDIEDLENVSSTQIPLSDLLENQDLEFTLEAKIKI